MKKITLTGTLYLGEVKFDLDKPAIYDFLGIDSVEDREGFDLTLAYFRECLIQATEEDIYFNRYVEFSESIDCPFTIYKFTIEGVEWVHEHSYNYEYGVEESEDYVNWEKVKISPTEADLECLEYQLPLFK